MIKVDIFSGFLGAGKTTLIKKLVEEAYKGEKIVLIENEFGEIGIDGGFLKDSGIEINEMNSGCICCSLVGDFGKALVQVIEQFSPDRILIEPSGVGKLSDIIDAVRNLHIEEVELNGFTTVVDASKARLYMKNFGEFFNNQIEHASSIILSHTSKVSEDKLSKAVDHNEDEHHHHHDHHDGECCCGHGHHHDHHEEHCGHEHHHDHHDNDCCCGHDHHHHHADEVFSSIGIETAKKFTKEEIQNSLAALEDEHEYGLVLRAKGIVEGKDGSWIHFDYVPGEPDVRTGGAEVTGRLCVIGSQMKEDKVKELFGI